MAAVKLCESSEPAAVTGRPQSCQGCSLSSWVGRGEPLSAIHRLIADLVMGMKHKEAKSSAICLRRTPPTTARSQDSRSMLLLICWEVDTPWLAGVQDIRWFLSFPSEP